MATKSKVRVEYDRSSIMGVAELTDSQIRSYGQQSQRLRSDLTYVVMPQWIHTEKLATPINGNDKSNRIFVVGVDNEGNAIQALTLSVNGLRARHYGLIKDNPTLKIEAYKNDEGLWRVQRGTEQTPVFSIGALPLVTMGNKAYISRPFAFKVNGRGACFSISFTQNKAGKYDVNHFNENGKDFVTLNSTTYNDYVEVDNVPEVDWNGIIGDEYSKDLPTA